MNIELILKLEDRVKGHETWLAHFEEIMADDSAIELHETTRKMIDERAGEILFFSDIITALESIPAWVKCSERMPEEDCDLAFIADIWEHSVHYPAMHGMVLGGRYRKSNLGGQFSIPGHCMNASHWLALPAPPTTQREEG